jgi:prolyl oligopeptidase PreP (S9A serine peptidase family)
MSRSPVQRTHAGSPPSRAIDQTALDAATRQTFGAQRRPASGHLDGLWSKKAALIFKGVMFAPMGSGRLTEEDFVCKMPLARAEPGIRIYRGGHVPTDRGFLENDQHPQTRQWLDQQAQYAKRVLDQTPLDALRRDLEEAQRQDAVLSSVQLVRDTTFYLQDDSLWSKRIGEPAELVMGDVRAALGENESMSISALSISPACRYAAVILHSPEERSALHVVDLEKGERLGLRVENPRSGNIHWLDDQRFLYAEQRKVVSHDRPNQRWVNPPIYEYEIGEHAQRRTMIFDSDTVSGLLQSVPLVGASDNYQFVVARNSQFFRSAVLVRRREDELGATGWHRLPEDLSVSNAIGHGSDLYLVSHLGAPNGKVIRVNPDDGKFETFIEEGSPIVPMGNTLACDSTGLYLLRSPVHIDELVYTAFAGGDTIVVPLPYGGVIEALAASPDRPGVTFRLRSYRGEDGHFHFDPHSKVVAETGLIPRQPAIEGLEVLTDAAVADDQERIEYVAVRRSGARGAAVLTTYGSYGFAMWPRFPSRADLEALVVKRNVTLAYGYIRGGAGKGVPWYDAGRQANKRCGAADISALGRDIVAKGYARPGAVALRSFSNGGLTAWHAVLRDPDVFAAVLVESGVSDATASPDSLTGPFEEPEIGTRDTAAGLRTMLDISPFHMALRSRGSTVRRPGAFVQAREQDVRVPPGPQRRMAAALADLAIGYTRATGIPHAPVVYWETPGGHRTTGATEGLAFLLWQAGLGLAS